MDRNLRKIIGVVGDALSNEILMKSVKNLSSIDFSQRTIPASEVGESGDSKPARQWSITNRAMLSKSGYKRSNKRELKWEVGFDSPTAYHVNYGAPRHTEPFENIYIWAYHRKPEIKKSYGSIKFPGKKQNPKFYKLWNKYHTAQVRSHRTKNLGRSRKFGKIGSASKVEVARKSILGKRIERLPFIFAYYVWLGIMKKGTPPTFFFSDAVYTTYRDARKIIEKSIIENGVKFVYDEKDGTYSQRDGGIRIAS